jgi:hypothetical protein
VLDDSQGAAGEARGDATGAFSTLTGSPVEVEGIDQMEACVEAEGCPLENHLIET